MPKYEMSEKQRKIQEKIQEKCQTLLTQMLRDEDNKYCVDCDAKGPRWASWNLGVFLCIRCAGIHRNLGVHISRVKSVNLDTWTPEQVISLQQMGNSRARAVYEAQLPDGFRRPQTDTALESFIRAKYEHKKYLAREWVPPSPPKVDWSKEIDEELEKQKRKKKAAQANSALGIGIVSSGGSEKKSSSSASVAKTTPLPAPLPKPKAGQQGSSPKTQRLGAASATDLLGLSSPTKPTAQLGVGGLSGAGSAAQDLHNDSFSGFLSASPAAGGDSKQPAETNAHAQQQQNSLAKEEEDFFNQGSLNVGGSDKDKSGKLTKDSILALYGTAPAAAANVGAHAHNPHNPQMSNFGQPQPFNAFTGMAPGYMGAGPHPQQPQFMTPPNSASMYNAPVMTAPAAFTGPGMHLGGAVGGAQFPVQANFQQQMMVGVGGGGGGGIMTTTGQQQQQQVQQPASLNLMHTNQSLLSLSMAQPPSMGMSSLPPSLHGMPIMGGMNFQTPSAAAAAASTANLNQQFGNLNIGNVWQ